MRIQPSDPHSNTKQKTYSAELEKLPLLSSLNLHQQDAEVLRSQIRADFLQTFDCYSSLFECLNQEASFTQKPISLRHPLIFYYGHTATFYINKLLLSKLISVRINPHFESIFAVGVDEMSWDDLNDAHYDWPSSSDVLAYRIQVKETILQIIDNTPLQLPITWEHPWWVLFMAIEHERIHLETSSVLIRQHDLQYVRPSALWQAQLQTGTAPENVLLPVVAGDVWLNKSQQHAYYGWGNEYGIHEAKIEAFQASKYLVSNAEFLDFYLDHGYRSSQYWEAEGQNWLAFSKAQHPTFWRKNNQNWQLRLMTEEVPMPWDWPVEVNFHEAKAFCNWKAAQTGLDIRLPTEDEWYRLYDVSGLNPDKAAP